jgi:hypothetical protein
VLAFIRQWPWANWANWAAGPSCQHMGLVVRGDFVSCWAGTMGLDRSPALARRRARAGPSPITSCWAHARVGPKCRALGWPMGLVLYGHI